MRWMFCCLWLACCSLDTNSINGTASTGDKAPKRQWTPRATATSASSVPDDASVPAQTGGSSAKATRARAGGSTNADAGSAAKPASKDMDPPKASTKPPAMDAGTPPAQGVDAAAAPMTPVDAGPTSAPAADAAGPVEPLARPDAAVADAGVQIDNILVWFALTGSRSQRLLMAALIADLEGTRQIDNDGMISVLRNFDELECRRNIQLCLQVCIWATSRCSVCQSLECQLLMYQRCGGNCSETAMPSP